MTTMEYAAVAAVLGAPLGELMRRLTCRLIRNRIDEPVQNRLLVSRWSPAAWVITGALASAAIACLTGDLIHAAQFIGIFMVLVSLSVVDGCIRRIPNELLLALMVLRLIAIMVSGQFSVLLPSLAGLAVGLVMFMVPSRLGVTIGWGDVKLAAVMGFCLGIAGLFQAVIIMGITMAIYALVLVISRRGSLKSRVAMGPPLSLGMLVTLLFPVAAAL